MNNAETRPSIGPVQVGIALLALGTASIHLYLFLIEGLLGNGKMLPIYQLLFVGNFFAYVTLASALLLPLSALARIRSFIRTLLIAIAVASIASYFYVGVLDVVGNVDKAIEILLIVLVTVHAATSSPEEDLAGRYAGPRFSSASSKKVRSGLLIPMALLPLAYSKAATKGPASRESSPPAVCQ